MNSAWNCLHITMACFYTAMGILQIAAGVYFLFWARFIHLSGFLWVGSLDTVIGIGGGILACLSEISTSRQKVLLFMSVSVLLINTVNTIVSEYYFSINSLYIRNNKLIHYNPWTYKYAKLTGVLLVVVSFFDALLIFVSYSNLKITNYRRFLETRKAQQQQTAETAAAATATITKKTLKNSDSYDPDLAFVIDTQQTKVKKKLEVLPQETQTNWVFGSRSVSKQDIGTSTNSPITPHKLTAAATTAPTTTTILSNDYFLNNNNTLRTFSRSASPSSMHNLSKTESDFSLDEERQPETIEIEPVPLANKIRKNNPYSNLMAELEKAFENKKKMVAIDGDGGDGGVENTRADSVESLESVSTTSSSKQLCRELEAVLQSIEHLDSPENEENDGDGDGDGEDDDDKGTCDYEYGSKTSLTTSGYSSPTGQKPIPYLNYSISTNPKNNATIISLTTTTSKQPEETATTKVFKSVTEIKTDYEMAANVAKKVESLPQPSYDVKVDDGRKNRLFSFLGQKKRPDINKLSKKTFFLPEVENAILKSETLAFLTRDQLLAKLDQNVAIRRKIEQKVQQQKQQLGHIVSESHC